MATHERRACSAYLNLVAPPMSSTVAASITKDDKEVINILRDSHFYMICGRSVAKFGVITLSGDGVFNVEITLDSGLSSSGQIHTSRISHLESAFNNNLSLTLKYNEKYLSLLVGKEIIYAILPDELLIKRGRGEYSVTGFDNYLEMMTFDLLYVGIAKENQDSYSRLIEKGHTARMNILSAEEQRTPGARVSDETYLLLFKVEPLAVTVFSGPNDFDDDDFNFDIDYHRIIADAEKAVISTFKPKYNKQLYVNYPKGKDGLFEQGYDGYSYSIAEGIALNTAYGTIKGARDLAGLLASNDADFISVDESGVTLNISGVDFNIPFDSSELES
ncbi:hypothetical protein [Pectobacterium polaris]|uniref:hypothetical protein n=1 Tax=Pectobacterium polaris TaxID=2042057 RepID=UPI0020C65B9F|nr:hypothetical protein [Pectobacterium polaris]